MTHILSTSVRPEPWSVLTLGDGRMLSYAGYGDPDGQPLVLMHGTPGSRLDFEFWGELLRTQGVRGIAVDRPGSGQSSIHPQRTLLDWPRDVQALADHLGLTGFTVLGTSGGGPHALVCGYALPDRVRQVVLVASGVPVETPHFTKTMSTNNRFAFWVSRYCPALLRPLYWGQHWMLGHRPDQVIRALKGTLGPEDAARLTSVDDAALRRMLQEAVAGGTAGLVQEARLHGRFWGFNPEDVQVPVTIWHGQQDHLVPVAGIKHLAQRLPDVQVHLLDRQGHLLDFDPETLLMVLRDVKGRNGE